MSEKQPILRDLLAIDRTHLANERTVLSFIRTALYMVVTGLALLNFYPESDAAYTAAWILFGLGILILVLGIGHYIYMKRRIYRHYYRSE